MNPDDRVATPTREAEAVVLARELYGMEAEARALPGEYDDNFRLRVRGAEFVLKVMHPARDRGLIDLQCAMLERIAARDPGLRLPRVQPTSGGQSMASVRDASGEPRLVWMLTWTPGTSLGEARPHSPALLASLGRLLGRISAALDGFDHPAARRELKWDLSRAGWIREHLHHVVDPARRRLVEGALRRFDDVVAPALPLLRRSVVYGDANEDNTLVGDRRREPREVVGVIDFGDAHHGVTVAEAAIGATYATLGEPDVVGAVARVVAGYHAVFPLEEREIALLHALIGARLAVSVTNAARMATLRPDDPYVTTSEEPAWEALQRLAEVHPRLAHYRFRHACGLASVPDGPARTAWLLERGATASPVLDVDLRTGRCVVLDLGVRSTLLGADPRAADVTGLTETIVSEMRRTGAEVGVGRYDEPRVLYSSALFGYGRPTDERRTLHLGIDLFVEAGAAVRAPLDGVVHTLARNDAALDYGPVVILRHETSDGGAFFTLYGHLSLETLTGLRVGQTVAAGEKVGTVGDPGVNGGWPPHVHFQVILDLLDQDADFPGVALASQREVWTSLSPDPNLLLGIPRHLFPAVPPSRSETLAARRERLGANLGLSYREPLEIVRGWMQFLYDETGRAYLDMYNNVPLVGHSHPRVVRAVQEQIALLNTNTRYLHDNATRYAERLLALLPAPLRVCFFLNSGSEANELGLRLARAHIGREDVIVLENAYHGHTGTLVDVSPYKFAGPGGAGRKPWVHVAPMPDDYRGAYRREDPEAGVKYAGHVLDIVSGLRASGGGPAAFLAETLPSVGGQIVLPPGYLGAAYRHVRAAGGVCIADEVQVGFGRLGTHFWGFETQGVVPDIVVLGKPIGNGFPLAAVVTTPGIAASFASGMEFFSTFGGNPVACAAGLAVLDVLRDEGLPERAHRVGSHLMDGLRGLMERRPLIGDVRGAGLYLGVELVHDRVTRAPAIDAAAYVVNRLRERGVLAGTDGPHENVLKLRPPLILGEADADLFLATLDDVLAEDPAQP